jgi:NADPH:quinone reductase-like Zn-dependent oxidoreductase
MTVSTLSPPEKAPTYAQTMTAARVGPPEVISLERVDVPEPRDQEVNATFVGGYAEYAFASAKMIASKPRSLSHIAAASVPVVAVTAWQVLFDHACTSEGLARGTLAADAPGLIAAAALLR